MQIDSLFYVNVTESPHLTAFLECFIIKHNVLIYCSKDPEHYDIVSFSTPKVSVTLLIRVNVFVQVSSLQKLISGARI